MYYGVSMNKQEDFNKWNTKKKAINIKAAVPSFREREIWIMSVGVNVGNEINGRGVHFCRPVLILKWVSANNFIGLPLTGKIKNLPGYYKYDKGCVVFEQVRMFSARRLLRKRMKISEKQFAQIKESFFSYIH